MQKKKKKEITCVETERKCKFCDGIGITGKHHTELHLCSRCKGKGVYIDKQYFHTANNICIDGDTLK